MQRALVIAVAVAVLAGGCARKKKHARAVPPPPAPAAAPSPAGWTETGIASWYGHPYHGRASASGEIYDMEQFTAAHRTLPFQTRVLVYDLDNNKTVEVRINDRGPFVEGRIIDLSHVAARSIDMIGPGLAKVRIEVLREPAGQPPAHFAVQVGAYQDRRNAERVCSDMERRYGVARLVEREGSPVRWRVLVGSEASEEAAEALAARIRFGHPDARAAFVVRLDL